MKIIYLIESESLQGELSYKIGITQNDPMKRLKTLQTGNSNQLKLLQTFESNYPTKLEKALHSHYKLNNIKGEWFNLTSEEVELFLGVCQKIEHNLVFLAKNSTYFQENILKKR